MNRKWIGLMLVVSCALSSLAQGAEDWKRREWMVGGLTREALVRRPDKVGQDAAPLVFVFHGHGGTMGHAARSFRIGELWPEAIVVCMQGLPTPGRLTDPDGKKAGWQNSPGDQGDRDVAFFDAVLASIRQEMKVDENRIYSTGHSNGGGFTCVLWAMRGEVLAAVAPSSSAAIKLRTLLKPKPMLHIAGENDPLVKYEWQTATIDLVKKLNSCGAGRAWELDANCTVFPSETGNSVVTAIHPGGHEFPKEAPGVIVKFFKGQKKH